MRTGTLASILAGLLLAGHSTPATAQQASKWTLHLTVGRDAFGGASLDSVTVPSVEVEVTPAPRLALEFGASRTMGAWEASVSGGYSSGNLRAVTADVAVDDRSGGITRYRMALTVARRIVSFSPASLHAVAGPVLDRWKSSDLGGRTVWGGRMGAALRFALGRTSIENAVLFTVGGSPFDQRALPSGVILRPLRTWTVAAGMRYSL